MRATFFAVLAASLLASSAAQSGDPVTGALGNATVVENNPPGKVYKATLPEKEFFNPDDPRGNVKGSISAVANDNGIGVTFKVKFENLPTSGGPFPYHLHVNPVADDGNCTGTLAHLDPFIRGETEACNPDLPQTCQVGDLSGKYGKIDSDPFTAEFSDDFASTADGIGAFFGNRSFVVHFANKTRITCANFKLVDDTGDYGSIISTTSSISTSTTTSSTTTSSPSTTSPTSSTTATSSPSSTTTSSSSTTLTSTSSTSTYTSEPAYIATNSESSTSFKSTTVTRTTSTVTTRTTSPTSSGPIQFTGAAVANVHVGLNAAMVGGMALGFAVLA
ncbi:hypothetical protein BP6252_09118 [Coleophoma cylindrospora]|uniref:superoxide dismutase n=1 Tax=Coleophoma cylindrospora TaxID=1849047 RepID=A0A3D8R105_9HELO|nr:hypothetical protein BP6252_09118 [Coleophoma cylindrospora]